jgi:ATP-binding protein involved in chromosome partitioning
MTVSTDDVMQCLSEIVDPCSVGNRTPMSITEMGLIRSITVGENGEVRIDMRLTAPSCLMVGHFNAEATSKISKLPGVTEVKLGFDAGHDWSPDMIAPRAQRRRAQRMQLLRTRLGERPSDSQTSV